MAEQDAMARFEMIQQALQRVDAQLGQLEETAMDLRRAVSTLESLAGEQEALVPIGGGVHIHARIQEGQPIISPIGRGYAAERDTAGAKADLEKRLQETEEAIRSHAQEADRLAQAARQVASQIQADNSSQ